MTLGNCRGDEILTATVGPDRRADTWGAGMGIESSVTSLSWIPRGATEGFNRLTFGLLRVAHYDQPPPEVLGDLDELVRAGRVRFANRLEAWIEVRDGRIVDAGQ